MGNGYITDFKSFSIQIFSPRKVSTGRSTKQISMLSFFGNGPISPEESDVETEGPTITKKKGKLLSTDNIMSRT